MRTFLHIIKKILCSLVVILFITGIAGTIAGAVFTYITIQNAPEINPDMVAPKQEATYIYDAEGKREQKLTLENANREIASLSSIPINLQHAFVAIEDTRFYQHKGIDPIGIIRAAIKGILTGRFSEGASTITQQLLKNNVFTNWENEKTFLDRLTRKIQEQYLALQLEKSVSKDRIMENYLNTINLGEGCYGVQAAAWRYFGKDVSELTLSECAVIAGITQNPSKYNPVCFPENNQIKQKIILQKMTQLGFISEEDMNTALNDNVYERIQETTLEQKQTSVKAYTYYQDALITQVINDLIKEKNYTRTQAYQAVYGGLRIYSAQDKAIQAVCDEEFANPSNFPKHTKLGLDYELTLQTKTGRIVVYQNSDLRKWLKAVKHIDYKMMSDSTGEITEYTSMFKQAMTEDGSIVVEERISMSPQPQASLVIIDQSTGYVKALIGGRGEKTASLTFNRATQSTRQPGSTFKILTAFAPAMEENNATLATLYENNEFTYDDGTKVNNWHTTGDDKPVTMREAIIRSINTAAVDCITRLTPEKGYEYAQKFGITTLVDNYDNGWRIVSDKIQPLALGGIAKGVTGLELCSAYAAIANNGNYIKPKFYTKVTDAKGNILLQTIPENNTVSVISPETAFLMTSAMQDVIQNENGTAHPYIHMETMSAAGKTGTTNDYKDIWFAGYTPYYTCCIWGGYDNNTVLSDDDEYLNHGYDMILWNNIMNRIHKGRHDPGFTQPETIKEYTICQETGLIASKKCKHTYKELLDTRHLPDECKKCKGK